MNIFVGCSSINDQLDFYSRTAERIADFIIKGGHNLVFGGCGQGLMGTVYSKIIKSESSKTKIIVVTAKVWESDLKHLKCDEVYICDTVNERDQKELELSDAFVFLPGGIGTLEGIFMAIETKRTREHDKPIIIVNRGDYFSNLIDMLDKIFDERFANDNIHELYFIADNAEEVKEYLTDYESKTKRKMS